MSEAARLEADVWAALDTVGDPCMCMAGKGLSIVDMGLVTSVAVKDGAVAVDVLLTDPNCLFEFRIKDGVKTALETVADVTSVTVAVGCYPVWTEDRLSERARRSFEADRQRLLAEAPRRPPGA